MGGWIEQEEEEEEEEKEKEEEEEEEEEEEGEEWVRTDRCCSLCLLPTSE